MSQRQESTSYGVQGDSEAKTSELSAASLLSRHRLLARALLALIPLVYFVYFGHLWLDDAFITYRYSSNLATTGQPLWNIDEAPVEGFTSSAWMVWNSVAVLLNVHPLLWSRLTSTLALVLLGAEVIRRCNGAAAVLAPVVVVLAIGSPLAWYYAFGGMETAVFFVTIALIAFYMYDYLRADDPSGRMPTRLYLLIALVILLRPEGLAVAGVASAIAIIASVKQTVLRRPAIALTTFSVTLIAVQTAWRILYFGYPLPNTYYAKHSGRSLSQFVDGLSYTVNSLLVLVPSIALALLVLAVCQPRLRRGTGVHGLAAAVAAIVTINVVYVVYVGGDETVAFGFGRLYLPSLAALVVLVLGLQKEGTLIPAPDHRSVIGSFAWAAFPFAAFLAMIPVAFLFVPSLDRTLSTQVQTSLTSMSNPFQPGELSQWIDERYGHDASIAVPWAGRVPFEHSGGNVIDTLGLNNEHIAHNPEYPPTAPQDSMAPSYVLSLEPDLVFIQVQRGAADGSMSFEDAGGWKQGDRLMIDLLNDSNAYALVEDAPVSTVVFERVGARL
ncbi:MAG: hypothetical protein JJU45_12130 [Acidimicrobiia bacterium]|nr:hypothetical protein [Acidimicrobiia bacterium]